jgi:polysaccharide export outer membrane protein
VIRKVLGAALAVLLVGLSMSVRSQGTDPLQALKDSMSGGGQGSILQSVLGKGDGTGKKSDKKLESPDTVQQNPQDTTGEDKIEAARRKGETLDGHILRQADEDLELRADDSIVIELIPLDQCIGITVPNTLGGPSGGGVGGGIGGASGLASGLGGGANGLTNGSGNANASNNTFNINCLSNNGNNNNANNGLNNLSGITGINGINGVNGINGLNSNASNNQNNANRNTPRNKPKTDEEKERAEKFKKRILSNNPYKLNHFGVLELPGLPAIPLAGLTAHEATMRLGADADLVDYAVRLTLLRLLPAGHDALKPFGYDLFEGVPSTFAPVSDIQVPIDYVVGPGDTMEVQIYGNENSSFELTVERDGRINIPKLGPVMVSGLSFDAARSTIENRVAKQLIGTRVSVTMGDLRSIRVFVLGEAEKPGSYTVSGLSTMTNALFVSGGVKKIGSLRNIQLKRNGRLITTLDLYDLLLHGDTSGDRQLMPGDVIFIPPIGPVVSVDGAVRRPAIYELKSEKTVEQAIDIAGGLMPDADSKLGQVDRILPSRLHQMHDVDLTASEGRGTLLANGDKLKVPAIRPTLENSVELTGYVFRPGEFEYHEGLRLSDILGSFDELRENADPHYIMIRRQVPPEEKVEVISADLKRALAARGSAADPLLRPRDKITVFNLSEDRERILEPLIRDLELQATPDMPEQIVKVDGRVKAPGQYPLEPSMHVSDLIRAGGSLEDAAYRGQAEITRYQIVDGDARQTALIPVNLAAIWRGEPGADIPLKPYDILVIKPVPMWMEPGTIELAGEVRFPGKYPIHQGETLHSVLERAGGFTDISFPEGAVYIREELKEREKDQLELLANRLQSDLAALSLEAVASSAAVANSGGGGAGASQGLIIGQQLLAQLRDTKPVGRLVINVEGVFKGRPGGPDDVIVKDGDKLIIPKTTQEITILGEVQSPTSHVYAPGLTRNDYIAKSGGTTQKADLKRIYVVRANGDVISGERTGWFRRSQSVDMHPGDTIVVPLNAERINKLPIWQAVTTIIYNLAIGFVLVHAYL